MNYLEGEFWQEHCVSPAVSLPEPPFLFLALCYQGEAGKLGAKSQRQAIKGDQRSASPTRA